MTGILNSVYQFAINNKPGRDNAYEDLAVAIVMSAAEDYETLYFALEKCQNEKLRLDIICKIKDIEHFFKSGWGDTLCFGHADHVWQMLCKEYGGVG